MASNTIHPSNDRLWMGKLYIHCVSYNLKNPLSTKLPVLQFCPVFLTEDIVQEDRTDCGMNQRTSGNSKVDKNEHNVNPEIVGDTGILLVAQ